MAERSTITRLALILWLTLSLAGSVLAQSPEVPHLDARSVGNNRPVRLEALQVSTWDDGDWKLFYASSNARLRQGSLDTRAEQILLAVDVSTFRRTGEYRIRVAAEGNVTVDGAARPIRSHRLTAELNTVGNLQLESSTGPIRTEIVRNPFVTAARNALGFVTELRPALATGNSGGVIRPVQALADANPGSSPEVMPSQVRPAPTPIYPQPLPSTPESAPTPQVNPQLPTPGSNEPPTAPVRPERPQAPPRLLTLAPRTGTPFAIASTALANGEQAIVVTGGVLLTVRNVQRVGIIDIEADSVVLWTRGNTQQFFENMRSGKGETNREMEFYLSGNVVIRSGQPGETRKLSAEQVYYNVSRDTAIALSADIETTRPRLPDTVHVRADEIIEFSQTKFRAVRAEIFSSKMPADPGLKVFLTEADFEEIRNQPRRNIFGLSFTDPKTGGEQYRPLRYITGRNAFLEIGNIPVFYLPYARLNADRPFGPLVSFGYSQDTIFGSQIYTTFDAFDLLAITPPAWLNTNWTLAFDHLSERGPAIGTDASYSTRDILPGLPGYFSGIVRGYGILDNGQDVLGDGRGREIIPPNFRGRFLSRHFQNFDYGFSLQAQLAILSDRNFLEQYYKLEFDQGLNQESFVYLKQQQENWAWTILGQPQVVRDWLPQTVWGPKVEGYWLGQSWFDVFTTSTRAGVGYAQLRSPKAPPPPVSITDNPTNAARFNIFQEIALPLQAGPVKIVPYVKGDLAYYSEDLTGEDRFRAYGGVGVRSALPLSRLYPDVQSELWNVNGLFHKVTLGTNYYIAHSDTSFTQLPQFDRLDDDATDQSRRDITPNQIRYNPAYGGFLQTNPLFNLQLYAIRRLVDNRVDSLDSMQVLQVSMNNRLQTKRGYPGMQHITDWIIVDLSATIFPDPNDNFGKSVAFAEYNTVWNIGDRTALQSTGWLDPFDFGARQYSLGAYFNRIDRTYIYAGYVHTDPLQSRLAQANVTYVFSPKYAISGSVGYDFGIQENLTAGLSFTRIGSDVMFNVGFTYNALVNNFNFTFQVVPNLLASAINPGQGMLGANSGRGVAR